MSSAIQRLAARLAGVERRVAALSAAPQLAHSSVEVDDEYVSVQDSVRLAVSAEAGVVDALERVASAEAKLDGVVTTTFSATAPADPQLGDVWWNTTVGRPAHWDGDSWEPIQDADVQEALAVAAAAEAAADGAIRTFYGTTTPTATGVGDLWVKEPDNLPHRWDGTTWVPLPIGAEAIGAGAVDLGSATSGRLPVERIDTGVLSAAVTLAGELVAGDPAGARVVMDEAGLRQYGAAGEVLVNIPNDANTPGQFEGAIVTDSIVVEDRFALNGISNEVARGAVLAVSSGTGAPTAAPTVTVDYPAYAVNRWLGLTIPLGMHSNAESPSSISAAATLLGESQFIGPGGGYYTFPAWNDSAGTRRTKYGDIRSGVGCYAGGEVFVTSGVRTLSAGAAATGSIDAWDLSPMVPGQTVAPTLLAHMDTTIDGNDRATALGRVFSPAGSTLLSERFCRAIRRPSLGTIELQQFSTTQTSITPLGSPITIGSPLSSGEWIIGVTHGFSDKLGFPGAGQYVWLVHGKYKTYAYNANASQRIPDFDFPTPAGMSRMYAFGDLATNEFTGFRCTAWVERPGVVKLTNNHWLTGTSDRWWVRSTLHDPNPAGGGTYESAVGPAASVVVPKRAGISITVPPVPARPFP
ncbi:MAG: hypothetical protein ACRCZD_05275, partial [Phycicoccus sp.]